MKTMIELRAESRRDAEILTGIAEKLGVRDESGFAVIYLDESEARHLGFVIPDLFSLTTAPTSPKTGATDSEEKIKKP